MRMILTSDVWSTLFIACGVMKINCRPIERRAAWMIIFMLRSRLTLSMKTSLQLLVLHAKRGRSYLQFVKTADR
jgi:hypothetical protein